MLTPEEWAVVAGAIATFVGAVTAAAVSLVRAAAESAKMRAEVAKMRADMAGTAGLIRETHHQVIPNNGGSLMDASTRTEAALTTVLARLDTLDTAARDTAADVRGLRRDIGRLADADQHMIERKERDHDAINARLDTLAARLDGLG